MAELSSDDIRVGFVIPDDDDGSLWVVVSVKEAGLRWGLAKIPHGESIDTMHQTWRPDEQEQSTMVSPSWVVSDLARQFFTASKWGDVWRS